MTLNKWTLRKALRTLLIGLLTSAWIYALARLMFASEIAMFVLAFIGIMVLAMCLGILLFFLLIYDDEERKKKPDDFSFRRP